VSAIAGVSSTGNPGNAPAGTFPFRSAASVRLNPRPCRYLDRVSTNLPHVPSGAGPQPTPPEPRAWGDLFILGGGGHALVVAEAAEILGWRIAGFFDDDAAAPLGRPHSLHTPASPSPDAGRHGVGWQGAPRIGSLADWRLLPPGAALALGLGHVDVRRRLLDVTATRNDLRWPTLVHPSAEVSPSAHLGRGVFVAPRAVVHTRATVADFAIINTGAIVEHDCVIGRNVHVAPGCVLAGATRVGDDSLLGVGTRTIPRIEIGANVTAGAGSVILRAVAPGSKVMGVPARPVAR